MNWKTSLAYHSYVEPRTQSNSRFQCCYARETNEISLTLSGQCEYQSSHGARQCVASVSSIAKGKYATPSTDTTCVRLKFRRCKSGTKEVLMASATPDTHDSTLSPIASDTTKLKNAGLKVIKQKGILCGHLLDRIHHDQKHMVCTSEEKVTRVAVRALAKAQAPASPMWLKWSQSTRIVELALRYSTPDPVRTAYR